MIAEPAFLVRLSAQSTVGELPTFDHALDLSMRGQAMADLFDADAGLPGVVVTEAGDVRGVISRGQYLRLISRQFGHEVYLPREVRLMWKAVEQGEDPLVLSASTPIQTAVSLALERPRSLIYEPVIVSDGPTDLNLVDFPDLLRADARLSTLRNQQMSQILETVREGFLLVDPDFRIASEYSSSVAEIFETRDLAGRRFPALLEASLGAEMAELASDFLDTLFNPNVIEHLVAQINPLIHVAAALPSGVKHLAFRFVRSVEGGEIRRILVRVEDQTRQVELAEEVEAQQALAREKVDLAFDIVKADPDHLGRFLGQLDQLLGSSQHLLGPRGDALPVSERLAALFRDLHALKGEAAVLGMDLFARVLHRVEDRIETLRAQPTTDAEDLATLASGLDELRDLAREASALLAQFGKIGRAATPAVPQSGGPGATDGRPPDVAPPPPEAPSLFEPVQRLVASLAEKLGKPARFVTEAAPEDIPEPYRELVHEVLVQLARNAMVHGLEAPEARSRAGKPALGTLQFAVRPHPDGAGGGHVELVFQDDGAGLDVAAIRRRAVELGLTFTEADVPMLIFRSGFSTAAVTTMDAGRGVGMDV
ncbi:MAG: Hpt domain-containing protein, partial [Acidobacteriota bacterium]